MKMQKSFEEAATNQIWEILAPKIIKYVVNCKPLKNRNS